MKPGRHISNRGRLAHWGIALCFAIQSVSQAIPPESNTNESIAPVSPQLNKSEKKSRDLQRLLSFSEFTGLLRAVGELNESMRLAAENPMDEWRRERVRAAVAALPGAIRSLAGVFQSDKLGNSKLPLVQQVLGGYVDVNAADNYNKFLRSPSLALIPKVGSQFPKEYLGSGSSQSLVMREDAPERANGASTELVDLELKKRKSASPPKKPVLLNALPTKLLLASWAFSTVRAEGEDGQESGGKAANFLFGLAAIIGAAAPMVAAGMQADADKKIAKTNQQTAITTTQISADTSKYLAENQKGISEAQMAVTQQIAAMNNNETTKRLNLQLAELRSTREENNKLQRDRRQMEYQLNQERIALAQKQADDNVKLAKAALSAQFSQAGLSQGLPNSSTAANRLNVSRTTGAPSAGLASSAVGGRLPPRSPAGSAVGAGSLQRAVMSSRLLSTLRQDSEEIFSAVGSAKKLRGVRRAGVRGKRFRRAVSLRGSKVVMSRQLGQMLQSNLDVLGSSPDRRAGSDLSLFKAQVSGSAGEGYAEFRSRALNSLQASAELIKHTPSTARPAGGYRRPALTMEAGTHSGSGRSLFNMPKR